MEPSVGIAGETVFRFGLENWEDDGLSPVTYELRYRDPLTNGTVPLVSRTATNEFFSVLPPVTLAEQGYELNILAYVIDKVNAKAVVETTVILREPDLSHSSDMTLCLEQTTPLDLDGCGESDTRLRVVCENATAPYPGCPCNVDPLPAEYIEAVLMTWVERAQYEKRLVSCAPDPP